MYGADSTKHRIIEIAFALMFFTQQTQLQLSPPVFFAEGTICKLYHTSGGMSIENAKIREDKNMKDTTKTDRAAIIRRIMRRLEEADDKTLREIERWVIHWTQFRRERERV